MARTELATRDSRLATGDLHWPEYLMEGAELGLFMISAGLFGTLLEHPSSVVHSAVPDPLVRRALMGLIMGGTAIAIVHTPWGRRSGAHFNPAVTLTFWRLGKVKTRDAIGYAVAQFTGALMGIMIAALLLGGRLMHPAVNSVATVPGRFGVAGAFLAEVLISFGLMTAVLWTSNSNGLARWTPWVAGSLVALYITFEAPVSGMSMNPARTFGSAVEGQVWTALWVYFLAPPVGMLAGAEAYLRLRSAHAVRCAKLLHDPKVRCLFCGHRPEPTPVRPAA